MVNVPAIITFEVPLLQDWKWCPGCGARFGEVEHASGPSVCGVCETDYRMVLSAGGAK